MSQIYKGVYKIGFKINKQIGVEISSYCGARCLMCPIDEYELKNKTMSMETFRKIIDETVKLGMESIDLCMLGDSMTDPNIEQKLRYIRESYPTVRVYTSNTCHKTNIELIAKYIDTLKISMYGYTKETYEKVHRGVLKFEDINKNIEGILALSDTERPYVHMSYLILPENEHEVEMWKEYWEPKVDEIWIWKPHNWGGGYYDIKKNIDYSQAKTCERPWNSDLSFKVNGDVSMCCLNYRGDLTIGNILEQGIEEMLQGDKLKEIRRVHQEGSFKETNLSCKYCDQLFDRTDALVYSTKNRKAGVKVTHKDYTNNFKRNKR